MDTAATGTTSVTKNRRFKKLALTAAVAIPTAALLAASVSAGPSSAAGNGDDTKAPRTGAMAKRSTTISKCDGGAQKHVWDRGATGWIYTSNLDGPIVLPGSTVTFNGPSHGKDALSVNLSAMAYLSPGSTGVVKVLVDGTPIRPSDNTTGTPYYNNTGDYGTFAQNYCRNVGPGSHTLQVQISDRITSSSAYYFELNDPLVHAELAE